MEQKIDLATQITDFYVTVIGICYLNLFFRADNVNVDINKSRITIWI